MEIALGIVGGGIITILVAIAVEMLRQPQLRLELGAAKDNTYGEGRPARHGRFLYVDLFNSPLPRGARWMSRSAAQQCRGTISFWGLDGRRFFAAQMPARFSRSPEPVPMEILIGGTRALLIDPMRLSVESRMDLYPGERTPIDVAVKFDGEDDAYAWSNLNYFSNPPWRHPDWNLPRGQYLAWVTVFSSGQKCEAIFRVFNDAGPKDFRLEVASPTDQIRVRRQAA